MTIAITIWWKCVLVSLVALSQVPDTTSSKTSVSMIVSSSAGLFSVVASSNPQNLRESKNDNPNGGSEKGWMNKIKRVVVLMVENRSFDHFFGFAKALLGVNGLTGNEWNALNLSDPSQGKVTVDAKSPYLGPCDPNHGTPATASKIANNMSGFINWENNLNHASKDWCGVMSMFPPDRVPVITKLAQEFALMDRFFCSHPGPTWPNRMFALSGTSAGETETGTWYQNTKGKLFPQPTIMDQVAESNMTWRNYYNDTPWEMFMETIAHNPHNLANMDTFFKDAAEGTLPNFAWMNPRSGINVTTGLGSNDDHPDHDVALGERLFKDVYEALRASPQWNETLFVITMDEHGGFYDHVTPPRSPGPNDKFSPPTSYPDAGYKFDSLGVRIPTLLISPWIPKGTVVSAPPQAQKPQADSEYDLTSIMATTRKLLNMNSKPLTDRDAWAATFEHVFSLDTPRTDAPMHLPDAPAPSRMLDEANLPINDLQRDIVDVHAHLAGADPVTVTKQGHVAEWTQKATLAHIQRMSEWKESKANSSHIVVCAPSTNSDLVAWVVNHTAENTTIHTKIVKSPLNSSYCMSAKAEDGEFVIATVCYPEAITTDWNRKHNRDSDQLWIVNKDGTVRPASNANLCITTQGPENNDATTHAVTLQRCQGTVRQSWAYHDAAAGNAGPAMFMYGDDSNFLQIS